MKTKFGERLKELRLEKNLTQDQLSKALKGAITQAAIAYWEQNKRTPTVDAVFLLADFFGVTIDYLVGRED